MDDKEIKYLQAENSKLKRMIQRNYGEILQPYGINGTANGTTRGSLPLRISSILASEQPIAHRINKSLKILGEFVDVSRIYIFENVADTNRVSNTYEWCNEEVKPEIDNLQNLSYDDFVEWRRMLENEGLIKSSNIFDLHPDVHDILSAQNIQSILVYPLYVKSEFYGFIGFDECSFKRDWLPYELDVLQMASRLLSNTFEREAINQEIRNSHAEILKINKDLADKEQFLQNILGSAPIGIVLLQDKVIEYANEATIVQSGYSKDELIGKPIAELYSKNKHDAKQSDAFYNEIDHAGISSSETYMLTKDNQERIVRVIGTPASGLSNSGSYLLIAEDITEIKETENHLLESEERNRRIIEASIDGTFIFDNKMKPVYANASGCEMLGYSAHEISDLNLEQIFPDQSAVDEFKRIIETVRNGSDFKGDTQLATRAKVIVHAEIFITTINLNSELHFYLSVHNITNRKNNEVSLKQSEHKFRALTENSKDHIVRIDKANCISYCNGAFLNDFDLDFSDCAGKQLTQIKELPKELVNGLSNGIHKSIEDKSSLNTELEFRYRDKVQTFDWTITPESDGDYNLSSLLIVGRNYTQKKLAEQELRIAKEKAIGADKLKSAFLANMSHEIRTPLNAIVGFTNLLKEENISDEEKTEYIDIVNKSSENLMELINDIVDLAKIESGELTLNPAPCNIPTLLKELHLLFEKRMSIDKKTHLKFYLNLQDASDDLTIICDRSRLRQILMNLIGNAFKFTQKGFVEIGYTLEEGNVRFYVRDTGIGINADKQSVIFEPFRQADESTSKHYGGTGLGLSICNRLVDAHGGKIGLRSEAETGSEFFFTIPLKMQPNGQNNKPANQAPVKKPLKAITPANFTWSDKIMLLIDATSTSQLQMRKVLERTKITLISARTHKSARELLLKRNDINIVLMDVDMPGVELDGFIKSIKDLGIYVPFIGQTSQKMEPKRLSYYKNVGFDYIFEKPVNSDELLHAFNKSLNGTNVLDQA